MSADDGAVDAGDYGTWLWEFRQSLRTHDEMDVPCGACNGCCRSSMFIHIRPYETDTLAHIPVELLFPAPNQAIGHVLMGYDEHGHCPMLVDDRCSIYDHRPLTCRTFDCRVYAAAGVDPGRPAITERTRHWEFSYESDEVEAVHVTIRGVAELLAERTEMNASQRAVLAVERPDLYAPPG
jgi:Fe-S-cluster containining protein